MYKLYITDAGHKAPALTKNNRGYDKCGQAAFNKVDLRTALWYIKKTIKELIVIKSFAHKGLKRFFEKGEISGIQPHHQNKLRLILALLNEAENIDDMNFPGSHLHKLKGDKKECWSVKVSGNWRVTFYFKNGDVYVVNYEDYH